MLILHDAIRYFQGPFQSWGDLSHEKETSDSFHEILIGYIMTESLFHGLWNNNPHITGYPESNPKQPGLCSLLKWVPTVCSALVLLKLTHEFQQINHWFYIQNSPKIIPIWQYCLHSPPDKSYTKDLCMNLQTNWVELFNADVIETAVARWRETTSPVKIEASLPLCPFASLHVEVWCRFFLAEMQHDDKRKQSCFVPTRPQTVSEHVRALLNGLIGTFASLNMHFLKLRSFLEIGFLKSTTTSEKHLMIKLFFWDSDFPLDNPEFNIHRYLANLQILQL